MSLSILSLRGWLQRPPGIRSNAVFCGSCLVLLCYFASPAAAQLLSSLGRPPDMLPDNRAEVELDLPPSDAIAHSVAGQHIGSVSVDPLMTPEQEAAILAQLWQVDDTSWRGWTVERLVRELSQRMPVYLNGPELDMLGVDPDGQLGSDVPPAGRLGMRLVYALEPLELTMQVHRGALEITSRDSAESDPIIRVYDVATISENVVRPSQDRYGWNADDTDSLSYHIQQHIAPDSWLSAGGCNGITVLNTLTRRLMVVSAPSETQWQVAKFLDVLNRSELNRGHPRAARPATTNQQTLGRSPLNSLPRSRDRLARFPRN